LSHRDASTDSANGYWPLVRSDYRIRRRASFPSTRQAITDACAVIFEVARECGYSADREPDLEIALREALANAVIHGNGEDEQKRVYVRCYGCVDEMLLVLIRDEGAGFDPGEIPDPRDTDRLQLDHGRGLFLMRALMDRVEFRRHGREVLLFKRWSGDPSDASESVLSQVELEGLSPAGLWSALDDVTREEAVRSVYRNGSGGGKIEADIAIANALRFRPGAVKKLPLKRRINYLLKTVHVDDSLASTILLALHLNGRVEILKGFLDHLGIPQEDGLIDEGYDIEPPDAGALSEAASAIYQRFDAAKVDLYLAALVALDPQTWGGLREVLASERRN